MNKPDRLFVAVIVLFAVLLSVIAVDLRSIKSGLSSLGGYQDWYSSGVSNTAVSVLAASTEVLSANGSRKVASIVNDSANVVYCSKGGTATVNSGIRLNANGGTLELDQNDPYRGAVNCIASATSTVVVSEK